MSLPEPLVDEERRRRFEAHRLAGGTEPLTEFLPPRDAAAYAGTLEELVCIDLEVRFKEDGPEPALADYTVDFPELAEEPRRERIEREITWLRSRHAAGAPPCEGQRLGRYVLVERAGVGAFSEVWRARDDDLRREVALKLPRPELAGEPGIVARLLREARSAARLHHPSIVPVFEAADEGGRPYIVSEFVEGPTLARAMAERAFTADEAAELVAQVADALEYAHRCGVVHRDVKPGNVLLAGGERPVLTDFGLAHLAESDAVLTRHGEVLGTPAYMAPEQARGEGAGADGRSDVYSLGVVLYELLAGRTPFSGKTAAVVHAVIHDEPPPPSEGARDVPADLDTVCRTAMAKEPERRYASAGAFAADLRRYLARRPIHARRRGPFGRLVLWARRNPALAATLVASVTVLAVVTSVAATRVLDERERFRGERDRSQELLYTSLVDQARAVLQARETGWYGRALEQIGRAAALDVEARDVRALRDLAVEIMGAPQPSFELLNSYAPGGRIVALAASPEHEQIAGISARRGLWVSDLEGRDLRPLFDEADDGSAGLAAVAFGGRVLAAGGEAGFLLLRDVADRNAGGASFDAGGGGAVRSVALHGDMVRDGALVLGREEGPIDAADPLGAFRIDAHESHAFRLDPARRMAGHPGGVHDVVVAETPDGPAVFSCGADGALRVWDLATGRLRREVEGRDALRTLAVHPQGTTIATHSHESFGFRLLREGAAEYDMPPNAIHEAPVRQVLFDAHGRVVTASADGTLRCFDPGFEELAVARGGFPGITAALLLRESGHVHAAYEDGTVRRWRLVDSPARRFFTTQHSLAFVPGSARVVGFAQWIDCDAPAPAATGHLAGAHESNVWAVAASPDGAWVATGDHEGEVHLWDARKLTDPQQLQEKSGLVWALAFAPDSRRVAICRDGHVVLRSVPDGAEVGRLEGHEQLVVSAAFHPTEPLLVSASLDGTLRVHDLETMQAVGLLHEGDLPVHQVAFAPDGARLAAACHDGVVRVWDVAPAALREVPAAMPPTHELTGHTSPAWAVAFDPAGRYLATGEESGAVLLRDADTLEIHVALRTVTRVVRSLSFDDGGRRLAVGAWIRRGVVWDLDEVRATLGSLALDWR